MITFTHTGCKANVAYQNRGRLFGHGGPKAGRRHALNGGPECYRSLCGERVWAETHDQFGFPYEGGARNVSPAGDRPVTCKRCLARVKGGRP